MTPAERFEHRRRRAARKARKRQRRQRLRRLRTLAWLSDDDSWAAAVFGPRSFRFRSAEYRFGVTTGRWSAMAP